MGDSRESEVSVILNPKSRGARRPRLADEIEQCLKRYGIKARVHSTARPEEGTQLARAAHEAEAAAVVAAGGDGTVNDVVQGIAGTQTALGVIPLGTGNVLASNLGLKERDIEAACKTIATGQRRTVDLGQAGERYFVAMAGAGLDAQVVLDLASRSKAALGRLAFVGRFAGTLLRERPRQFKLRILGPETTEVNEPFWAVIVCNMAEYTWRLRLAPDARVDDGLLDVIAFRQCSRARLLQMVTRIFMGNERLAEPEIVRWQARRLQIEADPPAPWHVEGDVIDTTPLTVEVCPARLRVLTPANVDRE